MKLKVRQDDIQFGENILKVKVPKALRNKVKSGLEYFDAALGGEGFTPSQVLFFTGTPGSGKTTMLLTLADRLTKSGALVVFNTAEESLYQVKLIAERLGLRSGFAVGQETLVPTLLEKCDALRAKRGNKKKPFFCSWTRSSAWMTVSTPTARSTVPLLSVPWVRSLTTARSTTATRSSSARSTSPVRWLVRTSSSTWSMP